MKKYISIPILVLSGILTAITTMTPHLAPVAMISIVPFIYLTIKKSDEDISLKRLWLYGAAFSYPFFLTIYHWFWYLYPMEFLGFNKIAAFFACLFFQLALSALQALLFAFIPVIFRLSRQRLSAFLDPVIFALIWSVCEFMHTLTWMGVPWARIALSQVSNSAILNCASLLGSVFVSFIIVLLNGYAALVFGYLYENRGALKPCRALITPLIIFSAVLIASYSAGALAIAATPDPDPDEAIDVALIQTNIGSADKWDIGIYDSLDIAIEMTEKACLETNADIVMWPETTLVFSPRANSYTNKRLIQLAKETGAVIMVGCFEYVGSDTYNALICYNPDGTVEDGGYYKRHLVPFGEYVPMRNIIVSLIPLLEDISMLSDDLSHGRSSALIDIGNGKLGRLICFDSIYPTLTLDSVRDGASVMFLSTNDSWYLDSASSYQHNLHAVIRAVESGRWFARCATTGISSIISPNGEITESLGALECGYVSGTVYNTYHRTLYSVVGDLFVYIAIAVLALLMLINFYFKLRKKFSS